MLLPIRTDYRQSQRPLVNYAIVAANAFIFLFVQRQTGANPVVAPFLLDPESPQLVQFFTSMFLHGGWWHILGNMLFLWVFGNAVNDRMGHVAYAAFYLAGGVGSCIGYVLLGGAQPVLGASGAISAVTGAYLVLFPRVKVTLIWLAVIMVPMEVSSVYFLGFQFVFNLWASMTGAGGGVAYVAHSAGYVYGAGIAGLLLGIGILPRDVYDLLSLVKAQRRRSQYRHMVSKGYDPFGTSVFRPGHRDEHRVDARQVGSRTRTDTAGAMALELRRQISDLHTQGNLAEVARKYLELINLTDEAVLPRQQQLDVANFLMTDQRFPQAATAYEQLLKFYPNYEHGGDIRLMLGIIYGRYLKQADRAEENLRRALTELSDQSKQAMAKTELEALKR